MARGRLALSKVSRKRTTSVPRSGFLSLVKTPPWRAEVAQEQGEAFARELLLARAPPSFRRTPAAVATCAARRLGRGAGHRHRPCSQKACLPAA